MEGVNALVSTGEDNLPDIVSGYMTLSHPLEGMLRVIQQCTPPV
jgi:hypothetical protein